MQGEHDDNKDNDDDDDQDDDDENRALQRKSRLQTNFDNFSIEIKRVIINQKCVSKKN